MYLIVIHIPFQYVRPRVARVSSDWGRSLLLLRDSFQGRFGQIVIAAPVLPPSYPWHEQVPIELDADRDDISFIPLCQAGMRVRQFWPRSWGVFWKCLRLARQAALVHCGTGDLYRPITQIGFLAAKLAGRPTIVFEDVDVVKALRQREGRKSPLKTLLYGWLFDRTMHYVDRRPAVQCLRGHQ